MDSQKILYRFESDRELGLILIEYIVVYEDEEMMKLDAGEEPYLTSKRGIGVVYFDTIGQARTKFITERLSQIEVWEDQLKFAYKMIQEVMEKE